MYRALGADIASLSDMAGSDRTKIGVVGFSMGGHWDVWLSQRPQYNIALPSCIMQPALVIFLGERQGYLHIMQNTTLGLARRVEELWNVPSKNQSETTTLSTMREHSIGLRNPIGL